MKIAITEKTIKAASIYNVNPVALAVAAATDRKASEVLVSQGELLLHCRKRRYCAAGFPSYWVAVPLPKIVTSLLHRWEKYGENAFPFEFNLPLYGGGGPK